MSVVEVPVDPAGEGIAGRDELGGVQVTIRVAHGEPPGKAGFFFAFAIGF
jgi:hypothetical protein